MFLCICGLLFIGVKVVALIPDVIIGGTKPLILLSNEVTLLGDNLGLVCNDR
jgi:hypothetical protein